MLGEKDVMATVAVKDLEAAAKFYEGTLGLKRVGKEGDEAIVYRAGGAKLLVYRSQYAGTNQATAVTWSVGNDLEQIVGTLRSKGVRFEHYDMPGAKLEGDIHVFDGKMKNAWLKDPDGNIVSLVSG